MPGGVPVEEDGCNHAPSPAHCWPSSTAHHVPHRVITLLRQSARAHRTVCTTTKNPYLLLFASTLPPALHKAPNWPLGATSLQLPTSFFLLATCRPPFLPTVLPASFQCPTSDRPPRHCCLLRPSASGPAFHQLPAASYALNPYRPLTSASQLPAYRQVPTPALRLPPAACL